LGGLAGFAIRAEAKRRCAKEGGEQAPARVTLRAVQRGLSLQARFETCTHTDYLRGRAAGARLARRKDGEYRHAQANGDPAVLHRAIVCTLTLLALVYAGGWTWPLKAAAVMIPVSLLIG
jgi:hypothetical protein